MKNNLKLLLICLLAVCLLFTASCRSNNLAGETDSELIGASQDDEWWFTASDGFQRLPDGTIVDASGNPVNSGSGKPSGNTSGSASGGSGSGGGIGQEIPGDPGDPADPGLTTIRLATSAGSLFNSYTAGASVYADMFKAKAAEVKKTLKVNLKFLNVSVPDENAIATALYAGQKPFDILYYTPTFARNLALSGLLLDQKSISTVNLNAAQFKVAQGFNDGMTFKNKVYGSIFGSELDNIPMMFCNQTMIDTYTNDPPNVRKYDVMQLYKDGQWTMDKYREICKAVRRADDKDKTTVWGTSFGLGNGIFINAYAGATVGRDAQGNYYPAMLSDAGVQAINFTRLLQFTDKSAFTEGDGMDLFKTGKLAMIPFQLRDAPAFVPQTDGDVVALPIPKAPTQSDHAFGARGSYYMIPKTIPEAERDLVGKVYMALSGIDLNKYYLALFTNTGMSKENGELALAKFPTYAQADYVDGPSLVDVHATLLPAYNDPGVDVGTVFESARPRFQARINDCYDRVKNLP